MQRGDFYSKHFFRVLIFAVSICLLIFLFFIGFIKAFAQDYAIRKQIRLLEREKTQMEQNKLNLLDRLQEIKSNSFLEKEARLKFGLQKSGESVILLNTGNEPDGKTSSTAPLTRHPLTNANIWWRYFFQSN